MHRVLAPIGRALTLSLLLSGSILSSGASAAFAQSPNQGGTVMTDPAQAGKQFEAKPGHASAGGNASAADAAAHPAAQPAPGPAPAAKPPANPPAPAGGQERHAATDAPAPVAPAAPAVDVSKAALIKRGEYVAIASDCAPCHMAIGGTPYAGGLILNTPFGQMATPNITPDRETGIGNWTADQFYGVIHNGIGPGHQYIYPTMTFTSYTKMPRADVDACAAPADLVELPVQHPPQPARLADHVLQGERLQE
jgi:hypothetical protein